MRLSGSGRASRAAVLVAAVLPLALTAQAQVVDPVPGAIPSGDLEVRVEVVTFLPDTGSAAKPFARPMLLSGDGTGRTFVADQNGVLYQLRADGSYSVFLDVASATSLIANQSQKGLSSFAFHPDHHVPGSPGFGRLYTASAQTTTSGVPDFPVPAGAPEQHHSVIHEWQVDPQDPDVVDPASAREVLRVGQIYADHNVGQIGFDPNAVPGDAGYGLLYVAFGDGGNFGCCPRAEVDPWFVGQDLSSPLGTILRIDPLLPAVPGAAYTIPGDNPFVPDADPQTLDEIWAYGLRNPHRFSWDAAGAVGTRLMLISDIGQSNVEEINLGRPGANFGWSEREGTFLVIHDDELNVWPLPPGDDLLGFDYPAIQYDHDEDDRAVSGGYVYRGEKLQALRGRYVFGDLRSGRVFHVRALDLASGQPAPFEVLRLVDAADGAPRTLLEMIGGGSPAPRADLRFGMDDAGEIYLLTKADGGIRRLLPSPVPECNDGVDNDADGDVDFGADAGCGSLYGLSELPDCADGLDNDGDGWIDAAEDPGCGGRTTGREDPACDDGLDNDRDGAFDFPDDAECAGAHDASERPPRGCGLGAELLVAVLGVASARRRRAAGPERS